MFLCYSCYQVVSDVIVVSTVFVRSCFSIVGIVVCVDWSVAVSNFYCFFNTAISWNVFFFVCCVTAIIE